MARQRHTPKGGLAFARKALYKRWWFFAAAVAVVVFAYVLHKSQESSIAKSLVDAMAEDTGFVSQALYAAKAESKPESLMDLGSSMVQMGSTLGQVATVAVRKRSESAIVMEPNVRHGAAVYQEAVVFALQVLNSAMVREQWNQEAKESLWVLKAAAAYALTAVLPEYFFAVDDSGAHSVALAKGLWFLLNVSNALPMPETPPSTTSGNSKMLVDCARYGLELGWLRFCTSSFKNRSTLEIRRAAVLEELIALHPQYAPLRLHYAVTLALNRETVRPKAALTFIASDIEKLNTRTYVDPLHVVILRLCEAFVHSSIGSRSPSKQVALDSAARDSLKGLDEIGNCDILLRPFGAESNSSWDRRFRGVQRLDVMDRWQAKRLLGVMKALKQRLYGDSVGLPSGFVDCS